MQQILLHPGFHRTGTSSIQHFLWRNHEVLAPHVALMMMRHMKPVIRQCSQFSITRDALDLIELAEQLDTAFAGNPVEEARNLIVSAEGLCGQMPGRTDVPDYAAAPMLIQYVAGYLSERFPQARLRIVLTTRDAPSWLESVYFYRLRTTRLTLEATEFAKKYSDAAEFDAVLKAIAGLVDPCEVMYLPLDEASQHTKGPGCALLDLLSIPQDVYNALVPVGRANEGPDQDLRGRFLDLNQSGLSDSEVADLKEAMAKDANLGGWKKH